MTTRAAGGASGRQPDDAGDGRRPLRSRRAARDRSCACSPVGVAERNERLPERARGQIRYELDVDPRSVTILECRPPWKAEYGPEWTRFPIARLRYTAARKEWSIYWRDRNLKFHLYDLFDPTPTIQAALDEVEQDPTCIFWG